MAKTTVAQLEARVEVLEKIISELCDLPALLNNAMSEASKALATGPLLTDVAGLVGKDQKPEKSTRGCRLPEGWVPAEATIETIRAEFPHITNEQLTYEHRKFADYWYGKAANATKRDWEGTWRNWMRRAFEQLPNVSARRAGLSTVDQKVADMQSMKDA